MQIVIDALIALALMSVVYWLIQKIAEWYDDKRVEKMTYEKDFEGVGFDKEGKPLFDGKE